ncbi:4-deoxy-L-threo-5-hexosulose-uronate ketol-isomerase [Bacillus pakistanensis]|uniref:4-deoxy-L-threo-5-hexosulose-uronate ketol-isomerase n=1 Tax=Rossellomorea pakistanensis TaxID=992288 RepID=A0ABS2NCE5_9BACI|nr:5-dehydro-4-deoxy-D-glucuronate isomerase [Bacillus pakistanensis]MBM7585528.1 4-deoxy-L-threo-5-hexosulose-uronate ketol-isomerase [Bacillus pakistanensis]
MDIRHATNPTDFKHYTTERIRNEYLIDSLFEPGEIHMVYSHYDRVVTGGAVPINDGLTLEDKNTLKTNYFLERREIGIINIGSKGKVLVDGQEYKLNKRDCLYVGLGKEEVVLYSEDQSNPARFYFVSTLAHKEYPTKILPIEEAEPNHLGSESESNKRIIYKYIHENGIQSCQLMMGMTMFEPNNIWNTMPAHLHDRRMEVYLYFDMDEDARVFHFMGEPQETRHIVMKNEQAVLSPPWSIHSGAGTNSYTFIWAMSGENYTFTDMDGVKMDDLR